MRGHKAIILKSNTRQTPPQLTSQQESSGAYTWKGARWSANSFPQEKELLCYLCRRLKSSILTWLKWFPRTKGQLVIHLNYFSHSTSSPEKCFHHCSVLHCKIASLPAFSSYKLLHSTKKREIAGTIAKRNNLVCGGSCSWNILCSWWVSSPRTAHLVTVPSRQVLLDRLRNMWLR